MLPNRSPTCTHQLVVLQCRWFCLLVMLLLLSFANGFCKEEHDRDNNGDDSMALMLKARMRMQSEPEIRQLAP